MARRKITKLIGADTEYSRQFSDFVEPVPATAPKPPQPASVKEPRQQVQAPKAARPKAVPIVGTAPIAKRAIAVRAVPLARHQSPLNAAERRGIASADIVKAAGKRALKDFTLSPHFVPKDPGERLGNHYAFRTMKTFTVDTLEQLAREGDPLGVRSESYLVQGQIEPVFWRELDAVLQELGIDA